MTLLGVGVDRQLHYRFVTVTDQLKQTVPQIRFLGGGGNPQIIKPPDEQKNATLMAQNTKLLADTPARRSKCCGHAE